MKFLSLNLHLLARITLTLIPSSAIIGCFQKVNFQGFNSRIRHVSYSKNRWNGGQVRFYVEIQRFRKIRDSLLCVTNRCIKVTSKLNLPSVSRFKFCHHYKSRVKPIRILRYFSFEPHFKQRWRRARDLFGSQFPMFSVLGNYFVCKRFAVQTFLW